MGRAKAALLVEGPQEARIRRRRTGQMRRRLSPKSGAAASSGCGASRSLRAQAARRLRRPEPEPTPKASSRLPAPADADAAQIDAGRAAGRPQGASARDAAARQWEASPPGGAGGAPTVLRPAPAELRAPRSPWRRTKRAWPGSRSRQSPGGIGSRAAPCRSATLLARPRRSKAAAACSRESAVRSAADDGGEWVKVGAREWTSNRRSRMTDNSGFIVSESLTRPLNFRHGVGVTHWFQG